jgi:hypothetical protein
VWQLEYLIGFVGEDVPEQIRSIVDFDSERVLWVF